MLQSKPQQLLIRYMTSLRQATELRPEDVGSVRLAMSMALNELQDLHREQLNDLDDITAQLLEERDQLKASAGIDANEILRLQTMEDRLLKWINEHTQIADADIDVAAVIIDLLNSRGGATVAPPTVSTNGHQAAVTVAPTVRYSGRRVAMTDDEIRTLVLDSLRSLAATSGRTPTQKEFEATMAGSGVPSLPTIKARLHAGWNELVTAAGLEPNKSIVEQRKEAKADHAEATFRGD